MSDVEIIPYEKSIYKRLTDGWLERHRLDVSKLSDEELSKIWDSVDHARSMFVNEQQMLAKPDLLIGKNFMKKVRA